MLGLRKPSTADQALEALRQWRTAEARAERADKWLDRLKAGLTARRAHARLAELGDELAGITE
jgi:hypothetical protein